MKANEFAAEGQIWSGVKQAAGGLGSVVKGVGNVLGGVATGAVQGLDILGGGSGNVGTTTQRAERSAAQERQKFNAELKAYDKQVPTYAITEFVKRLKEQQIDINNDKTFDRDDVLNQLRAFATEFYASDPGFDSQTKTLNNYMSGKIEDEPLPNTINKQSVAAYLTGLSHFKKIGLTNLVGTARREQGKQVQQQMNQLTGQIASMIRSGKKPPADLINKFAAVEALQQELYNNGVASAARTEMQDYVDRMLGTATGTQASATVSAPPPGMVNTVTVGTNAGNRKFFIDKRDQWYEYMGNNWPNEIELSRPVTDDDTVDFLAKQVADGRLRQEPYGTTRKRKR